MKLKYSKLSLFLAAACLTGQVAAQGTLENYKKAEKYLHFNIQKLVKNESLTPQKLSDGSCWYYWDTPTGYTYMRYQPKARQAKPFFSTKNLARSLSQQLNETVIPDSLNITNIALKGKHAITFERKGMHFEYQLRKDRLSIIEPPADTIKKHQSLSPGGQWLVFVKDYNLWVKEVSTGKISQLTHDGKDHFDYATPLSWYKVVDESKGDTYEPVIDITWNEAGNRFITYKLDRRKAKKLYLYQSLPDSGMRARVWSYERPLPGEDSAPTLTYQLFDLTTKKHTPVQLAPFADICVSQTPTWLEDDQSLYFSRFERGYKAAEAFRIDANTGEVNRFIREEAATMVEYQMMKLRMIKSGKEALWTSERDGYNHIYRYETATGKLQNQVTSGNFLVRDLLHVDENNGWVYFIAGGKSPTSDPYYRHLFKIRLDGTDMQRLTPEDADHQVTLFPDEGYFIDNFSRVDQAPVYKVRNLASGKELAMLGKADISKLLATGWKYPQRFTTLARDGKTPIYGCIFLPSHFDSTGSYPIIDATYSGPQAVRTPKSFRRGYRNADVPFAELGFAVITIDGMGTAMRSKAFHDVSYKNLGDIGAPDHMAAIRQLASQHQWLDTTRIGIYGHSAGGYDAAHALLKHPEFYDVAIASAGNHDHGMAKAWWPEQYMGMPGPHYQEQSNLTIAGNLQGHLLLITGDMDNNVNPASTFRLAAELVNHNRDFDLLIIPNRDHGGLYSHPYFIRKRWDYFVRHLMGIAPPKNYEIKQ